MDTWSQEDAANPRTDARRFPPGGSSHPSRDDGFPYNTIPRRREVILERLPVAVRREIPAGIVDSLQFRTAEVPRMLGGMAVELAATVLAHQIDLNTVSDSRDVHTAETAEFVAAATWRDMWKLAHGHRWWARWWVTRRPARTVTKCQLVRASKTVTLTVDLRRYRTFPECTVQYPADWGRHVHVALTDPPYWHTR